jgi:hypothetical protein
MSPVAEAAAHTRLAGRGPREPRNYSIAVHLMWFAAAILVPVLLIVTFMLIGTARMWRADSLNDARVIVHHLNATIELELEKAIAVSQTLATALALDGADHVKFEAQARDAAKRLGENIVVRDLTGQQVINTALRAGPLPIGNEAALALDRLAVARRAPVISDLHIGTVRGLPVVNVIVPVLEGTDPAGTPGGIEVRWLISVSLAPESLSQILAAGLPRGWIAGIVGQDGRLIARSIDNARYIGTANPKFLKAVTGAEGTWIGT